MAHVCVGLALEGKRESKRGRKESRDEKSPDIPEEQEETGRSLTKTVSLRTVGESPYSEIVATEYRRNGAWQRARKKNRRGSGVKRTLGREIALIGEEQFVKQKITFSRRRETIVADYKRQCVRHAFEVNRSSYFFIANNRRAYFQTVLSTCLQKIYIV